MLDTLIKIIARGPGELLSVALYFPAFSLVVAVIVLGVIAIVSAVRRRRSDGSRAGANRATGVEHVSRAAARETTALAIAAAVVIVVFIAEAFVPSYLASLANVVEWWRYATPPATAALSIAVVGWLILARGSAPSTEPVTPTERRSWVSFGPRGGLIAASIAGVMLVATTIAAGLASSADGDARFIYLELSAPNTTIEGVRPWFYGWSFGVPVLVSVALLLAATWGTLRVNAARSFTSPATVRDEQRSRREVAARVVGVAGAAVLLSLGGALRFINSAAGSGSLIISGDPTTYDITWRYAEFAALGGWVAPPLEIIAFIVLLRVLGGRLRATVREPERVQP